MVGRVSGQEEKGTVYTFYTYCIHSIALLKQKKTVPYCPGGQDKNRVSMG